MLSPVPSLKDTPAGVKTVSARVLDDGRVHYRVTEAALPTLRVVPNPRVERYVGVESLGWILPIDDTHFRIYVAGKVRSRGELGRKRREIAGAASELRRGGEARGVARARSAFLAGPVDLEPLRSTIQ